jgi:hypothetical protein
MENDDFDTVKRKLPVWAVVTRSYGYVWENRWLFAAPTLALFVVQLAWGGIAFALFGTTMTSPPQLANLAKFYLILIPVMIFAMAFAVGVHRTILLDERRGGFSFLRWDRYLLRYLVTSLLMIGIAVILVVVSAVTWGVLTVIALTLRNTSVGASTGLVAVLGGVTLIFYYVSVCIRFELAFPAAALGDAACFSLSWRATKGNVLRIFAAGLLVALPLMVIVLAESAPLVIETWRAAKAGLPVPVAPTRGHLAMAFSFVNAVLGALLMPILVAKLSLCYDILVRGGGPGAANAP